MSVNDYSDTADESTLDAPDGPRPLVDLTGFQRDVLFVLISLDGSNPSGTDVKDQLRETYGEAINHGRLYQNLRDLVDSGLVEKRPVDGRTNAYQVSPAARERLEAHTAWSECCLLALEMEESGDGE